MLEDGYADYFYDDDQDWAAPEREEQQEVAPDVPPQQQPDSIEAGPEARSEQPNTQEEQPGEMKGGGEPQEEVFHDAHGVQPAPDVKQKHE